MFRFMFVVPQKWQGEEMLLILTNTPIPKHYCLHIPASQSKFYVKIHVIKHDMDPNSNINYSRKIPPLIN